MHPKTVLIVEDEQHIAEVVALQLRKAGLKVVTAVDAQEALAILQAQQVALVVADVALPGMSGPELARVLAADPRLENIPLVLLTGAPDGVPKSELVGTRVTDVVQKPFSPRQLLAKVNEAIASQAAMPKTLLPDGAAVPAAE